MSDYDIRINRLLKESRDGAIKTEIWTKIKDKKTCEIVSKRIWWEDNNGIYHDGTPDLPIELRKDIDNAWIEKSRKW